MTLKHFDDLTKIDVPLCELDADTIGRLVRAEIDGSNIECDGCLVKSPSWLQVCVYRVKPRTLRPLSIDWSIFTDDVICAARDENGSAFAMTRNPRKGEHSWICDAGYTPINRIASYDPGEYPWDESIVWRSGHKPEGE
jgi:hypothetical protein